MNHFRNDGRFNVCVNMIIADQPSIEAYSQPAMEFWVEQFRLGKFPTVCADHVTMFAELKSLFV